SGKIDSDASANVEYAGKPLVSGSPVSWKVRTWDGEGKPSAWSEPAMFSMGLLSPNDWKGKWIAAKESHPDKRFASCNGYHGSEAKSADDAQWVQVDLGQSVPIDAVKLHPALPNNFQPRTEGFGFPVRF